MLKTSARQIMPRFIVWNKIMPKLKENKKWNRKFLVNLRVEIREFPFFTFSGTPKPRNKHGVDKKLGYKKLVVYCTSIFSEYKPENNS